MSPIMDENWIYFYYFFFISNLYQFFQNFGKNFLIFSKFWHFSNLCSYLHNSCTFWNLCNIHYRLFHLTKILNNLLVMFFYYSFLKKFWNFSFFHLQYTIFISSNFNIVPFLQNDLNICHSYAMYNNLHMVQIF